MARILKEDEGQVARRSKLLHLAAISLAENMRSGNFKSICRGQGIEFSKLREYLPGDNVRVIDWNVTARMGRAYIKQYDEDKELSLFIIIDRSLSMYQGTGGVSKLDCATETAALLIMAGEINSSSLGAVLFDGEVRFSCRPEPGRERAMMLLSKIDRTEDDVKKGSVLDNAIRGAHRLLKRRSLVFVLSDFKTEGWQVPLARLAQKHDVVAVRITDQMDSELPEIGTIPFVDAESGVRAKLPTSSSAFRRMWFDENRRQTDSWQNYCLRHGIYTILLSTADDCTRVLSKFFSERARS